MSRGRCQNYPWCDREADHAGHCSGPAPLLADEQERGERGELSVGLAILRSLIEQHTYEGKRYFTARNLQAVYDAALRAPTCSCGPRSACVQCRGIRPLREASA